MQMKALNESPLLRFFTFFYLYAMQGIPAGLALTAVSNYLLGQHVQPHLIGTFIGLVGLPWTIQFLWGPLIDRFQFSSMGSRKQWVVLSQLIAVTASAGLLMITDPVSQLQQLSVLFFVHSVFASLQDASVDAMAIAVVPAGERGRVNGLMRAGYLVGIALGSAGLSWILHEHGFRSAAMLQTMVLLFFTIITFVIRIDKNDSLLPKRADFARVSRSRQNPDVKSLFRRMFQGITQKNSLQYFVITALVYFCLSIFIRSFTFHLIHELAWPDKTVSLIQGTWGTVITFAAIVGGGIVSDRVGARRFQIWVMWGIALFLLCVNAFYFLWQYDAVSGVSLALWNLADPMMSVAAFPILMAFCADKVEGSQFTAYMAIINFCDVLGSYVSGWTLGTIATPYTGIACGIVIILLIPRLKRNYRLLPQATSSRAQPTS